MKQKYMYSVRVVSIFALLLLLIGFLLLEKPQYRFPKGFVTKHTILPSFKNLGLPLQAQALLLASDVRLAPYLAVRNFSYVTPNPKPLFTQPQLRLPTTVLNQPAPDKIPSQTSPGSNPTPILLPYLPNIGLPETGYDAYTKLPAATPITEVPEPSITVSLVFSLGLLVYGIRKFPRLTKL